MTLSNDRANFLYDELIKDLLYHFTGNRNHPDDTEPGIRAIETAAHFKRWIDDEGDLAFDEMVYAVRDLGDDFPMEQWISHHNVPLR